MESGGRAVIAIGSPMVKRFAEHRSRQDEERASAGDRWHHLDLVFATRTGEWVAPERFADAMDEIIETAGVPRITSEGMRRTARTLASENQHGARTLVDGLIAS